MNKKGFTLVELIVSFALISTISIFLFQIVSIISNIYSEKGIKTELILQQSNISNVINKDIYLNEQSGNYVKRIILVSNDEVNIRFAHGNYKTIKIDRSRNAITYENYTQRFLTGTNIGHIDVDFDYITSSSLTYDGVSTIRIPISYNNLKDSFDILTVLRFSSSQFAVSDHDDMSYGKFDDGTPKYFNVSTGEVCSEMEMETNYSVNNVHNGLSTGCMRFFTFLDDDTSPTVDMILDHNASLVVPRPQIVSNMVEITKNWQGVIAPDDYSQTLLNGSNVMTTMNYNWGSEGSKARAITANEVARIVGRTSFSSNSSGINDKFYLDGAFGTDPTWQTQVASASNPSKYWWLFSYLSASQIYGSKINNDVLTWGYWTSDKVNGTSINSWAVLNQGALNPDGDGASSRGIRPVIKVLKEKLIDEEG